MTLNQLRYVVTVAQKGSITEAANSLFISQPSLTSAIRELEKELGITIFHRLGRGIAITNKGDEFLSYARQVIEQANLLEEKFLGTKSHSPIFSVSAQHYSFAVNAFVDIIEMFAADSYDFTLKETQTFKIIEDVDKLRSEIGILFTSEKNREVIHKLLKERQIVISELFSTKPHVFVSSKHPWASREMVSLDELDDYPYLSYEQGEHNSFYFSEELLSSFSRSKNIIVSDRATLFNLAIGLNGYTVSSGIICRELNGEQIVSVPLDCDELMTVCILTKKDMVLSRYANSYIEALKRHTMDFGVGSA